MKKLMNWLMGVVILTCFCLSQSLASSKAPDPLDDFACISRHAFSATVNVGLYFDKPSTLTVSLSNDPDADHDGSLRSLKTSFSGSKELLSTLVGDFIFQISSGKDNGLVLALLGVKAEAGEKVDMTEGGIPTLDMGELIGFALKTGFEFERSYSTGGKKGMVRLKFKANPDVAPDKNWVSYPHPTLDPGSVGLHVIRNLIAQAHDDIGDKAREGMYL